MNSPIDMTRLLSTGAVSYSGLFGLSDISYDDDTDVTKQQIIKLFPELYWNLLCNIRNAPPINRVSALME